MSEKLEFAAEEHWEIAELGDIYGDRQAFDEWLDEKEFNKEVNYIKVTVEIIPK